MDVRPLLKTPSFIGGTGLVGSGGLGIGSWQVYEELNPTVNRKLSRQGYSYDPVTPGDIRKPEDNKEFKWGDLGCVNRLFPKDAIAYDDSSFDNSDSSSDSSNSFEFEEQHQSDANKKFTTCAIMVMKPIKPTESNKEDNVKNHIYFKSEVVIKGKDYGWIIWTGLSTFPKKSDSGSQEDGWDLTYRLLGLHQNGSVWEETVRVGWENTETGILSQDKFTISSPQSKDKWLDDMQRGSIEAFDKKVWVGIGEVVDSKESGNFKSLLESISIYAAEQDKAELWGSKGEFNVSGAGYTKAKFYNVNSKDKSKGQFTMQNISSKLKTWYEPFKEKKIKWTNLKDRCDAWSRARNTNVTDDDEVIRSLCYRGTANR